MPKSLQHFELDSAASSSTDKTYAIKIRIDRRYPDPQEQVRQAVLTCNCPSWVFNRDIPKTCGHTRDRSALLVAWQQRQLKRLNAGLPIIGPHETGEQPTESPVTTESAAAWLNDLSMVSDTKKSRRKRPK